MKKTLFLAMFLSFAAAAAAEESPAAVTPAADVVEFSFNIVSEPAVPVVIDGGRINLFYGRAKEVKGLSVGMVNFTDGTMKGAEFGFINSAGVLEGYQAGFVNMTEKIEGCQSGFVNIAGSLNGGMAGFVNNVTGGASGALCGFINSAASVNGAAAGFINRAGGDVTGAEAGFLNMAKSVKGVQAGFINMADSNTGLMSGFLNISGGLDGVAIGAINIIKGGFGRISLYSSVETLYNAAFKSGKTVYGILGIGYDHRDAAHSDKYIASCGLGIRADLKPFFIDIEGLHNAITEYDGNWKDFNWKTDLTYNAEVRILPGITLFDTVEIYGGPSVKYYYTYEDIMNREYVRENLKLSAVVGVNIKVF